MREYVYLTATLCPCCWDTRKPEPCSRLTRVSEETFNTFHSCLFLLVHGVCVCERVYRGGRVYARICRTSVIINIPSENIRRQAQECLLHSGHHFSPTPKRSSLSFSLSLFVTRSLSLLFPFIRAIIALQFVRCAPSSSLCSFRNACRFCGFFRC